MEQRHEEIDNQSLPNMDGEAIPPIPIKTTAMPDDLLPGTGETSTPATTGATVHLQGDLPQRSIIKMMLACVAGLIFPGLGHLVVGRWGRALLLALSIVCVFAAGLFWMDGHLYQPEPSEPLSMFPFIANAGLGGIYALCYALKLGFEANAAAPTYEFGNTLLFGSGLLNYLVVLDAFDIAAGRKA